MKLSESLEQADGKLTSNMNIYFCDYTEKEEAKMLFVTESNRVSYTVRRYTVPTKSNAM